jgi:hypothetical protein
MGEVIGSCGSCAWFPWKPGADLPSLPAQRCSPLVPMRTWREEDLERAFACRGFVARDGVTPVVVVSASEMVEQPAEVPVRPVRRRKTG